MTLRGRIRVPWRRPSCYGAGAEAHSLFEPRWVVQSTRREYCVHYKKHAREHVCEYFILALGFFGFVIRIGPLTI